MLNPDIIEVGPDCRERFLDQQTFPELKQQGIWLAGLSDLKGKHRIERVFNGRMMLSFALAGGSYYRVGSEHGHWQAGQALFVPPGAPLSLNLDEGGFRQSAWVILEQHASWKPLNNLPACFEWQDGARFSQALEALFAESFTQNSEELRRLIVAQCREYLLRVGLTQQAQRDSLLDGLLLDVSSLLSENWTLDRLVLQAGISRAQLHPRFIAQYGIAPMTKIMELRMQRARLLLSTSSQSIAAVGEAVGFTNSFYFSTAFKAQSGVSPRCWRDQVLGEANNLTNETDS